MKQFLLVVSVLSAVLLLAAGQPCIFDAVAACNHGDFGARNVFYARDACNCSVFWQCERTTGTIRTYRHECQMCLCFNDDTWVCSDRVPPPAGQVCPTQPPYYDFNTFVTDLTPQNPRIFRMNFDNATELQGIAVDISGSLSNVFGGIVGSGKQFDGTGDIGIAFFKNNMLNDFTFSLWFKRNASGAAGEQGLVFNGNDAASGCFPATIQILSTDTTVSASIITTNGTASITHTRAAALGTFHHVALRYNSTQQLDLYLDGAVQSTPISGQVLSTKCSLLIGNSVGATNGPHYFNGIMDEIRFYRVALSDGDVSRLFSSPGSSP